MLITHTSRVEETWREATKDCRTTGSSAEESGRRQREERRTDSEAATSLQAYY